LKGYATSPKPKNLKSKQREVTHDATKSSELSDNQTNTKMKLKELSLLTTKIYIRG